FTTHVKDAPPLNEWPVSFISDPDREVQQKWFGKIGSAEDDILALSSEYLPPIVFGNYTPTNESRNALAPLPDLPALRRTPDPVRLWELGVRYLYYDETALDMLSEEGREMLSDPALFTEVFRIEKGESVRILYRLADKG
ncbi:MAG: hypothetical protein K8I82_03555, partial [Anaerolineae bacterium]|nr:hypothetical protein [Anaerolineae bacterium]